MNNYVVTAACCAALFCFAHSSAFSAPDSAPDRAAANASVPTKITADRVTYDADRQTVVFTGNVYAARPDIEMWMDTLTVYFHPKSPAKAGADTIKVGMESGEVKKLVATGKRVRMKAETRTGICQRAEYDVDKAMLTMTGTPELQDGDRMLKGETVRYYIDERRSEIVGSAKRRVEAVFGGPNPVKKSDGGR